MLHYRQRVKCKNSWTVNTEFCSALIHKNPFWIRAHANSSNYKGGVLTEVIVLGSAGSLRQIPL